eukprot:GHRQ01028439.1.p2 GENE.GHRQ01028439.1~~GHRQ01028439.1.p2  ORF type:complete len:170 (-),score=27.31 GHRQ01028439.1:172-681(-)
MDWEGAGVARHEPLCRVQQRRQPSIQQVLVQLRRVRGQQQLKAAQLQLSVQSSAVHARGRQEEHDIRTGLQVGVYQQLVISNLTRCPEACTKAYMECMRTPASVRHMLGSQVMCNRSITRRYSGWLACGKHMQCVVNNSRAQRMTLACTRGHPFLHKAASCSCTSSPWP